MLFLQANVKVVIIHCKTNQALAVLGDQVLWYVTKSDWFLDYSQMIKTSHMNLEIRQKTGIIIIEVCKTGKKLSVCMWVIIL